MANYNKVGEETVVVEQGPTDDYSTSAVKPDVEAIAAALGCEVSSLGIAALDDKDNFGNSTANNGSLLRRTRRERQLRYTEHWTISQCTGHWRSGKCQYLFRERHQLLSVHHCPEDRGASV